MPGTEPDFTIGIEEEYLLVDLDSCALAPAPPELMTRCAAELEGQFSPEFLECQVEIGSKVCASLAEARADLQRLRSTVARVAGKFNLAPIAASCHPFSDWRDQHHTRKDRYDTLREDHHQRQLREEHAGKAGQEDHRREDHHGRQGAGGDGRQDLAGASAGRSARDRDCRPQR